MLLEERAMATRRYNNPINQDVSTRYASDLNDQEFALVRPHVAQKHGWLRQNRADLRTYRRDPISLAQRHNNQQLFSDHYLNVTLSHRPEWKLLVHDAGQALASITPIVRAYVPSDNEAQTERDLVRPVLEALGHTFKVQLALKTPDGTKKPVYVFCCYSSCTPRRARE
jgi:hypothetical protein